MSCTAAEEGLVAGLAWTEGAAAVAEAELAEEGIVVEAGVEGRTSAGFMDLGLLLLCTCGALVRRPRGGAYFGVDWRW